MRAPRLVLTGILGLVLLGARAAAYRDALTRAEGSGRHSRTLFAP